MSNSQEQIRVLEKKLERSQRLTWLWVLVILVLSGANIFQYVTFATHIAEYENSYLSYPLIDPSRHLIDQEDFIVNIQPLRDNLRSLSDSSGFKATSLYFEYLNTGSNISINQDVGIFPASLAKLPLAMVVVKKVETEVWQWDNELVLLEGDVDRNSGNLYQHSIGTRFTIEELVRELLVNSDNTAYRILLRNTESSELNTIIEEVGLSDLFKEDGKISAKEYTRMLRSLYVSSFLRRDNSEKILEWLTQSPFDYYLASGLPQGVKFAHKIGENHVYGTYSDAGIVYLTNRSYVLSVMVEVDSSWDEELVKRSVRDFMRIVSKNVYEYIQAQ